ncbi:MAG TPA: AAA family ATPase [Kofleriaceae bacterium]
MTGFDIRESQIIKADPYFQLKRVVTTEGEEFLIKLATEDRGHEEKLLEREFEFLRSFAWGHGLVSVRLTRHRGRLAAIYEPFDGVPLEPRSGAGAPDLAEFAETAAGICDIFAMLHGAGSLLLGVGPGSFLRSARTRQLLLADAPFAQAQAAPVDRGDYWLESPYLVYAAPELLGDDDRTVDHRADLYALGGLLYHLLAHRPMFDAVEPAEIRHCHLAKKPRHLLELDPSLPRDLAHAVMRLVAKNPLERFTSVEAFERAAAGHSGSPWGRIGAPSARPGRSVPLTVSFSTALYGNDDALTTVREQIERARAAPAIVFLEGEPGIGKTTLLRELRRLETRVQFCCGDFSGSGAPQPLGGWTSALIDLANAVLTSPGGGLEVWRARILDALGEWAPLIAALAPEWQTILRCPEPASNDPLDTSLNRLALAIRCVLGSFADDESPVVLVLEDLQWADAPSLRMLELIVTAPERLNLLVVAAVRGGEAAGGEASAVRALSQRLQAAGSDVSTIRLRPWSQRDALAFITDSLEGDIAEGDVLAELLLAKTHGNPFFIRELLRELLRHNAIRLEPLDSTWRWDRQALRRLPVTDNVIVFLSRRLAGLPEELTHLLRTAACLGREFRLADVCAVDDRPPDTAERALERAVADGLLIQREGHPIATSYEFVHDRVLEAARALLSDDARAALHLRIGRALLKQPGADTDEERSYQIASHFNMARHLVTARDERHASAELDLRAGRRAKLRGAFGQALEFLQAGLAFLAEEGSSGAADAAWRDHFQLTLGLHEATAEMALLNGQLTVMNRLCDAILDRVDDPRLKVRAYELRICGLKAEKKFSAAVDAALQILGELGIEFPWRPTTLHNLLGFVATRRRVFAGPVSRLAELPAMVDEETKAAGRIIQSVYPAAYLGRPKLFPFLVYRHVNASLEHGNEDYSGVTYTAFGVVLSGIGQFARAAEIGSVGLDLLRRNNADRLKAQAVMAYYTFIFPWQNHIRDTLPHYKEGLEAGLAHGDFEYASYIMTLESLARLHGGESLDTLQPELERHAAKIKSLGQERSILLQNMLCQMVHTLRHGPERDAPLSGKFYDDAAELPRCLEPLDANLVFHNYLAKLTLGLFLGDHELALDAARRGRAYLKDGAFSNYLAAVFMAYESLVYLLAAQRGDRSAARMRTVRRNLRRLRTWARAAPMNFANKLHLVEAERCRLRGRGERATEHYEKAIELADTHGFVHEAGLAQQRAASYYLGKGMERLGRQYLRDCYASYRRWGAEAVTRQLEAAHVQPFALLAAGSAGPVRRSANSLLEMLDYRMLLKSSQAISSEFRIPRLLERLLADLREHTGAQRALLVLAKDKVLHVELEAGSEPPGVSSIAGETVDDSERLCRAVVHYCARKVEPVVLVDAALEGLFVRDPYVRAHRPKSVLCTPMHHQSTLIGLVYLENNEVSHVFTDAQLELVNLLVGQAAISIANAQLHAQSLAAHQARINPHFLFNALSSIADLAISDGRTAEMAIVKLASLYRYILTASVDRLVTLDQELEIVRNYLILEKLRHGAKLDFTFDIEGDTARVRLPGLLIQPLVENSIRHGIVPKLTPGKVRVGAAVRTDRCCIVVEDDGDGAGASTPGTGFGQRSVLERLEIAYGKGFSFAIDRSGGYRVEIEIPAGE